MTPLRTVGRPPHSRQEAIDNFWSKVDKTGECWEWTLSKNPGGYGRYGFEGKVRLAHRLAWEFTNGPIAAYSVIDHLCHNPGCVNPSHLRAVTQTENMQNRKGAQSHSKSGVRGVMWEERRGRWMAQVIVNGKRIRKYFLGRDSLSAASEWAEETRSSVYR